MGDRTSLKRRAGHLLGIGSCVGSFALFAGLYLEQLVLALTLSVGALALLLGAYLTGRRASAEADSN